MKQPDGVMVAQMMLVHLVGVRISVGLPFFCLDPKAKKTKTQVFTSLCVAQLHSKGAAFSSLPRRNAMEPGHLHKNKEDLLVKTFHSANAPLYL